MTIVKINRSSIVSAILLGLIAVTANAKSPVKDTPVPADRQCDYVNYHHTEAKNANGSGKCATDCDCDGMRSCVEGKCSGTARPAKLTAATCNSEDYHYQEAWTKAGPGKCSGDCECDGLRTCVSGTCSGTARLTANAKSPVKDTPVPADGQCDYVNYHHNEAKNANTPGKCATDCDCDGMRSCVEGKCSGTARPAELTAATCNSKEYHYQEAWTKAGPGKCSGDCECDGLRTCVSGECSGTAR